MDGKLIWQSQLTSEMVEHLSDPKLTDLLEELDSAVADICKEYGID